MPTILNSFGVNRRHTTAQPCIDRQKDSCRTDGTHSNAVQFANVTYFCCTYDTASLSAVTLEVLAFRLSMRCCCVKCILFVINYEQYSTVHCRDTVLRIQYHLTVHTLELICTLRDYRHCERAHSRHNYSRIHRRIFVS